GTSLGFAKPLLGLGFGLAFGFLVLAVAFFLGLAAGLGGLAFGLLDAFAAVAAPCLLFGEAALLKVALSGVGQRAGACAALVFGQRAQHNIAARRRCRRRRRGTGKRCLGRSRLRRLRRMRRLGGSGLAADPALAALLHHDL